MMSVLNKIIHKLKPKATEIVSNESDQQKLLNKAIAKLPLLTNGGVLTETVENIKWLIKMTKSYFSKEYMELNIESLVVVIAAIIYFVNPLDFIPDLLPGGVIDDAAVLGFVIKSLKHDLNKYKEWYKKSHNEELFPLNSFL